jgi:hypothetical protein
MGNDMLDEAASFPGVVAKKEDFPEYQAGSRLWYSSSGAYRFWRDSKIVTSIRQKREDSFIVRSDSRYQQVGMTTYR